MGKASQPKSDPRNHPPAILYVGMQDLQAHVFQWHIMGRPHGKATLATIAEEPALCERPPSVSLQHHDERWDVVTRQMVGFDPPTALAGVCPICRARYQQQAEQALAEQTRVIQPQMTKQQLRDAIGRAWLMLEGQIDLLETLMDHPLYAQAVTRPERDTLSEAADHLSEARNTLRFQMASVLGDDARWPMPTTPPPSAAHKLQWTGGLDDRPV